jgi:alpha-D-ribose 1-methylphosphonate 5-triphosphate diphosphatase PhnM
MTEDLKPEDSVSAAQYNPQTGAIKYIRTGIYRDILAEGEAFVIGSANLHTDYIDLAQSPPAITPRPSMRITQDTSTITADGADTMTLSGLPAPCTVTIGNTVYDVPDGELEWGTLMPATSQIKVESFPYLNWEGEVAAIAGDVQTE